MRLKKLLSLALTGVMCLSFTACGGKEKDTNTSSWKNMKKTITLTESWDFSTGFYPILSADKSNNYGATYWNKNFYNTLLSYDKNGKIQGELAEKYEESEDGLTYTFKLKKGIKFSDGTPITSNAVKKSIEAAIVNLGKFNGSYGKLTTLIESAKAKDESTFILKLTTPYYGTLNDLTMCTPLAILNPKAFEGGVEKAYENCKNATMGSGPYMFKSFENSTYTFVKNTNYWGTEPEVDSFKVKVIEDNDAKVLALRGGEIDAIIGSTRVSYNAFSELCRDDKFGSKINEKATQSRYLGMNLNAAPFNDINVRQAVAYAVDQKSLETSVFLGIESAAETVFPKEKPYCNVDQTIYETNLEKAKSLMEKSGWIDKDGDGIREKDGKPLEINISYTKSLATIDDAALAISSQLKEIGFKVNALPKDMMSWYGDIQSGNYTLSLWYTYGGAFDPNTVMTNMNPAVSADPIAVQFISFIKNGVGIISELDSTASTKKVQEIYDTILKNIAKQCLLVPVTYTHEIAVWKSGTITGYDFYYDAQYVNIAGIHLK